jgi:hypothetical protein
MAALWPERCKAMVSVSGYLIGSRDANRMPLPPKNELEWWYQYYFATERVRSMVIDARDRRASLLNLHEKGSLVSNEPMFGATR